MLLDGRKKLQSCQKGENSKHGTCLRLKVVAQLSSADAGRELSAWADAGGCICSKPGMVLPVAAPLL